MKNTTEHTTGAATMKIKSLILAGIFGTALATQASVILPIADNSVTFEAEEFDAQSGTLTIDETYIDNLEPSAAGGGNGDFISFNISNLDPALTYEITFDYRNNSNGGDGSTEWEFYGVTGGPTYTLLTSIVAPKTFSWGGIFYEAPTSTSFSIAAGTTAIQVEQLTTGNGDASHLDSFTITATAQVPEPSTLALLGAGGAMLLAVRVRRSRANAA